MSSSKKKPRKTAKKAASGANEGPFYRPFSAIEKASKVAAPSKDKGAPRSEKRASKAPPAPKPSVVPPPSSASNESFAAYMAGVQELPNKSRRLPKTVSSLDKGASHAHAPDPREEEARTRLRALVTEGMRFDVSDDGRLLDGRRIDVDPRELRRLRKGAYGVDGKLDLHGLHADEARATLEAFVKKRASEGDRVLVVVHGKGSHSPRGQAVLRGEIGAWLSQGKAARFVAAFASVPDEDGFSGSLFVLLARPSGTAKR